MVIIWSRDSECGSWFTNLFLPVIVFTRVLCRVTESISVSWTSNYQRLIIWDQQGIYWIVESLNGDVPVSEMCNHLLIQWYVRVAYHTGYSLFIIMYQ